MRSWLGIVLISTGCGFSLAPATGADDAAIDADADAGIEIDAPPDARTCFGAGLGAICLTTVPTAPRTLVDLAFDTGSAGCTEHGTTIDGVQVCVVSGTTVEVPLGQVFHAVGKLPLVIVATQTLTIGGLLGASSLVGQLDGAGSSDAACATLGTAINDGGGAAGAAGGSFGGVGGAGGTGDLNNNGGAPGSAAGQAATPILPLTAVRGGCPGGTGGTANGVAGAAGRGGGAIYLIAGEQIEITGSVTVLGEGGGGARDLSGGGGGGSGGLIGLDAPMIRVSGALVANGGGGGEGAGVGAIAARGSDGLATGMRAPGGVSGTAGGDGGASSGGAVPSGSPGASVNEGGGGGGGGAGYIYLIGTYTPIGTPVVTPSPLVN